MTNLPEGAKPGAIYYAPYGADPDDPAAWTLLGHVDTPVPTRHASGQITGVLGGSQREARETWYLATCYDCDPVLAQPFTSSGERDEWTRAHTAATGHHVGYREE